MLGQPALHRTLGFWALLAYGIGDLLGAGIHALVGKAAGEVGTWACLTFAIAMMVAALTALTYSEPVTRFHRSGGEAVDAMKPGERDIGKVSVASR